MDKAIVTVLLIICGMVATLAMFNGLFPVISQSQSAISSAADKATDRMASRIQIIQAGYTGGQVKLWVKNVGSVTIYGIPQSDVFFGPASNPVPLPCGGVTSPFWSYELVGGGDQWNPAGTVAITITPAAGLSAGTYAVKMVIPNGVTDELVFSVA